MINKTLSTMKLGKLSVRIFSERKKISESDFLKMHTRLSIAWMILMAIIIVMLVAIFR